MIMCVLAVSLMWGTNLRVAVYIVSFFIDVPLFDSVVGSCNSTYQITQEERRRFEECVDVQVQQCDDELHDASYNETKRVNMTTAENEDTVNAARQVQRDCSSAYTSLRYAVEAWVDAGHSVPYQDNSTCSAQDFNQLRGSVGDVSAVRSEAFTVSSEYSDESQSTLQRSLEYAELRGEYDAEYIMNHTLRVQLELSALPGGIEIPALNVDQLFGDFKADVDNLISCVSTRSTDSGECPLFRGGQERLDDIRTEMERRMEVYRQEIASWRQKTDKYISNVQTAYDNSVRFYRGVKNAIPDWLDDVALNADWWDMSVDDLMPVDVTFPSTTPEFTDLPSFDDVWDSVSVSLNFFYRQLDSVEAKIVQLAEELGDGIAQDIELNLPDVTPKDYNPPVYRGSDNKLSSMQEELTGHAERSEAFIERMAVALDALSELSQVGSDEDLLQDASSFFNFTSIRNKLSSVDVSFRPLVSPGLDFDLWFLQFNSFGDALFLFDLLYRVYCTIRVIYKYWSVGALTLPKIDMRTRKKSNARNMLKTPTMRLFLMILINPAMGVFLFTLSMWWLVTIASTLYTPLYHKYLTGCVPTVSNGTWVTNNLFSLSYNHAYQDGSSKLIEGMEKFDANRGQICSSRYAPSASSYQNDVSAFGSFADSHNLTSDRMNLMKRCIDVDELDAAFRETCCDHEGYSSCSFGDGHEGGGNAADGGTCPMNDLMQPPTPLMSPVEHFANPSCNVNMMDDSSWKIEDSIFHCEALPYCDVTCEGPDQEKLERSSRECGCTVEWLLHSLWLKAVLSALVFALINASRIMFVDGLARLWWRRLHPDSFTVMTSCGRDGTLMTKRIKRRGEQSDEDIQAYVKDEIDRNMVRFQAKGLAMVACAVLANAVWVYVLGSLASSSTPTWLS